MNSELFPVFIRKNLYTYRFDHIAGGLQKLTEELHQSWIEEAIKRYQINNIALGGGVFMNVKANGSILSLKSVHEMFAMPSCGDESNAIGAAYWGALHALKSTEKIPGPLVDLYLGPSFSDDEVWKELQLFKSTKLYILTRQKHPEAIIARLLAKGEIVAIFQGRMEWGARALGNRSILANASNLEVISIINKQIKNRDFWMPFAPAILDTWAEKYLVNPKKANSPFMMLAFHSTPLAQIHLKAAMHQADKTLRPQIVSKKQNSFLYGVIKRYEKQTGMGGILNTSFNIHGEPIVCTPRDALSTFHRSGLRYLLIGNWLISKKQEVKISKLS